MQLSAVVGDRRPGFTVPQARQVLGAIDVEPAGSYFNGQPAAAHRLDGVVERGGGGPADAGEHPGGDPAAGDRVETAVFRGAERDVGRGREQRADVAVWQAGRVASENHDVRAARGEALVESRVNAVSERSGALQ